MKHNAFILLLALMPAAASAQSTTGSAAASASAQATAPQARIDAAMETALEAGIPTSLLESKVSEGKAKGIPMARIAAAVEARLQGLTRAQTALQQAGLTAASSGELLVASEALGAGVSERALIQVTRDAPAERRAVATAVLADLVRLGYDEGAASARLNGALSGAPEALVNLRAEAAASLRARGLISVGANAGVNGRGNL